MFRGGVAYQSSGCARDGRSHGYPARPHHPRPRRVMHVIYEWPLGVPIVLILLLSLTATELGYRYGRSQRASDSERDILSTIRTGTLGLVALLLGFSFAITSNRFTDRSRLVIDEANTIVTCYLRARLVGEAGQDRHLGLSLGINVLIVMGAFVVLDFDRPRRGLIRVDQTPLVQLRESMRSS